VLQLVGLSLNAANHLPARDPVEVTVQIANALGDQLGSRVSLTRTRRPHEPPEDGHAAARWWIRERWRRYPNRG
jgi:uracil-DNA glycosylase